MNTIVMHQSVDLDCITASWLILRFLPGWIDAEIQFIPAGTTLNNKGPDVDSHIIHIDTGFGKFDHHQTNEFTTATKLVLKHLLANNYIEKKLIQALERLVETVNEIDHFKEVYYPNPDHDRYDFMLHQIIEGLKSPLKQDLKILETGLILIDAIFQIFRNKVKAEDAIKKGFIFHTYYGKSIIMETQNEEAMKLALKQGFGLTCRKDPVKGSIRIKSHPDPKNDLTPVYQEIKKIDKSGTWFLHVSKHILINASSKNPNFIPSQLTSQKLIEILKKI